MARRQPQSKTWKRVREVPCPACLDRNALTLDGRPLFVHGMKMTGGCEVCGGTGRAVEMVQLTYPGGVWQLGSKGIALPA